MYTQEHFDATTRELKKIWLWLALTTLLLLAGYIALNALRQFWPSFGVFTLMVFIIIYALVEHLLPLRQYRQLLTRSLAGQGLEVSVTFTAIEETSVTRMGRRFREIYGTEPGETVARKFYIQADFVHDRLIGQAVTLRTLEHYIVAMTPNA